MSFFQWSDDYLVHVRVIDNYHKDLEDIFGVPGGEAGHSGKGRFNVLLKGHTASFHIANHDISKEEVLQIRKFLATCGVDTLKDQPN